MPGKRRFKRRGGARIKEREKRMAEALVVDDHLREEADQMVPVNDSPLKNNSGITERVEINVIISSHIDLNQRTAINENTNEEFESEDILIAEIEMGDPEEQENEQSVSVKDESIKSKADQTIKHPISDQTVETELSIAGHTQQEIKESATIDGDATDSDELDVPIEFTYLEDYSEKWFTTPTHQEDMVEMQQGPSNNNPITKYCNNSSIDSCYSDDKSSSCYDILQNVVVGPINRPRSYSTDSDKDYFYDEDMTPQRIQYMNEVDVEFGRVLNALIKIMSLQNCVLPYRAKEDTGVYDKVVPEEVENEPRAHGWDRETPVPKPVPDENSWINCSPGARTIWLNGPFKIPKRSQFRMSDGNCTEVPLSPIQTLLSKIMLMSKYLITIAPPAPKDRSFALFMDYILLHFPNSRPAFDGVSIMYSLHPLFDHENGSHLGNIEFAVNPNYPNKKTTFNFVIKYSSQIFYDEFPNVVYQKISFAKYRVYHCVKTILANSAKYMLNKEMLKENSDSDDDSSDETLKKWAYKPGLEKINNIVTREQSLINLIREIDPFSFDVLEEQNYINIKKMKTLNDYMKHLKIRFEDPDISNRGEPKKVYRFEKILGSSKKVMLKAPPFGRSMSVLEFFESQLDYTIKYPDSPCVLVSNNDTHICLPVELVTVIGNQNLITKLSATKSSPLIPNQFDAEGNSEDIPNVCDNFKTCIEDFLQVETDEGPLDPVMIALNKKTKFIGKKTIKKEKKWSPNLSKWGIATDQSIKDRYISNFVKLVKLAGYRLGVDIKSPTRIERVLTEYLSDEMDIATEANFQLFIKIQSKSSSAQDFSHQNGTQEGMLLQVLHPITVENFNEDAAIDYVKKLKPLLNIGESEFAKILKPICLQSPNLIIGAGVSSGTDAQPPIEVVTGSCGPDDTNYNLSWRIRVGQQPFIEHMRDMVMEQIEFYWKRNAELPETIIVMREGLDPNHLEKIRDMEIKSIREACADFKKEYEPDIIMFTEKTKPYNRYVLKRPQREGDHHRNHLKIVNKALSSPEIIRSEKFFCLWDDTKSMANELDYLTVYLSFCSRKVRLASFPTPVYFAQLAATRILPVEPCFEFVVKSTTENDTGRLLIPNRTIYKQKKFKA